MDEKNRLTPEEIKEVISRFPISMNMLAGNEDDKTNANFLRLASHHRHVLINFIKHRKPLSCEEYIRLTGCTYTEIMNAFHWFLILPNDDNRWRLSRVGKKVIEEAIKAHAL